MPEDEKKEETVIKQKKEKKKKTVFSIEEMQDKLCRAFNAVTFFLKVEKTYKETDFEEEAKDIVRLAEKYSILGDILTFLDPLFLVLGLFSKAKEIFEKVRTRKKQEKENAEAENAQWQQ